MFHRYWDSPALTLLSWSSSWSATVGCWCHLFPPPPGLLLSHPGDAEVPLRAGKEEGSFHLYHPCFPGVYGLHSKHLPLFRALLFLLHGPVCIQQPHGQEPHACPWSAPWWTRRCRQHWRDCTHISWIVQGNDSGYITLALFSTCKVERELQCLPFSGCVVTVLIEVNAQWT